MIEFVRIESGADQMIDLTRKVRSFITWCATLFLLCVIGAPLWKSATFMLNVRL